MKITKQEKNKNQYKFEIESDFESFKKARNEVIADFAKEMKVPGFRPGKAPKNIVEQNLNIEAVNDKAAQHLISTLYPKIISETKIDPVDYPNVEILKFEEGKPFQFSLTVDVYPEIKLGKYKGLKASKKSMAVTEDEVIKFLGDLQNRFAKHVDITDGSAEKDDLVDLSIQAEAEGAQIKRWPRELEHFPLGLGYISQEFDNEVVGMKPAEEKEFKVTFPATYNVAEIAGKEVSFKVKVKSIHRKELLSLDDEFAKMVSNYGSMAELKEEVKKNLEMEKKEESEADLKNQLITLVSADAEVDMPEALVRIESDLMLDELKTSLSRSNLTLEDYLKSLKKTENEIRTELRKPAESRAKGKVVLKKISEVENITVAPHDLDTEIALMAQGTDRSTDEYKKSLGHGGLEYVNDYLLRRKALDFLELNSQIELH